jgi:hypothetical protein
VVPKLTFRSSAFDGQVALKRADIRSYISSAKPLLPIVRFGGLIWLLFAISPLSPTTDNNDHRP